MAKYIHKMPFWNFLGFVLAPFALLGEGAIVQFDGAAWLHGVVLFGFVVGAWIKFNIKDENNNDVADIFEKPKK
jgi:hypothetical protein